MKTFTGSPPQGFATFKCAHSGCKRKATMMVCDSSIAHLSNDQRCYCDDHGWSVVNRDINKGLGPYYERIVEQASGGCFLYRKSLNAFGGYQGWEYAVQLSRADMRQRECPNPWSLTDSDGNYILE